MYHSSGIASKLGNGTAGSRQHQYPGVTLRRDPANLGLSIAFDPHYAHLSPTVRRESSASATSSLGSFESGSTLTSDIGGDTAIMTRLRKSFEQKEEFLRRGVTHPEDATTIKSSSQFGNSQANQDRKCHRSEFRSSLRRIGAENNFFFILLYSLCSWSSSQSRVLRTTESSAKVHLATARIRCQTIVQRQGEWQSWEHEIGHGERCNRRRSQQVYNRTECIVVGRRWCYYAIAAQIYQHTAAAPFGQPFGAWAILQ